MSRASSILYKLNEETPNVPDDAYALQARRMISRHGHARALDMANQNASLSMKRGQGREFRDFWHQVSRRIERSQSGGGTKTLS